jgi:hypothetical protein
MMRTRRYTVKSKTNRILASAIGLLILAVPLLAHHGTGISYDSSKMFQMTGTITEFRYANPHPQLFVDVKDKDGKVVNWGLEVGPNPAGLVKAGWGKRKSEMELKPGTVVTVTVSPSKAGTPTAVLNRVVKNGQILDGYDFGNPGGQRGGQ